MNINNLTIYDSHFTGTDSTAIFEAWPIPGGYVTINNLNIIDSDINFRNGIRFMPLGAAGVFSITDLTLSNVTLNTDTSLIRVALATSLSITDVEFSGISPTSLSDDSTSVLAVDSYIADGSGTFEISNMTGYNSSISMLTVNSIIAPANTSQSLLISEVAYRDSVIQFPQDLIRFTRVEIETDFSVIIENLNMENIEFERYGNTLMLAHHNLVPIQISGVNFTNLVGSSLHIESNNRVNSIKTMVNIDNMYANSCHGGTRSLINSYTGGQLEVRDSSFTNIDTFESGSIINGRFQDSTVDFYN